MTEPSPTQAYVVRVAWKDKHAPDGMTMFYAALTATAEEAAEAVRKVRPEEDEVAAVPERLSARTTRLLSMRVGEVRAL